MISPMWYALVAFESAAIAAIAALVLLSKRLPPSSYLSLSALLGATAMVNVGNGMGLLNEAHALWWRAGALVAELIQPSALLYVGQSFLASTNQATDRSGLWRARFVGLIGASLSLLVLFGQVYEWTVHKDGVAAIAIVGWGRIINIFIVIGMAFGLAQLEVVLHASQEPIRHKLKFIVIGLGGLAGYQIYQSSQLLLQPVWQPAYVLASGVVTTMSLCLVVYGLGRSRLRDLVVRTYVSQQALVGSVTFIVIGLYLLAVGAVGEWLRQTNQPLGIGLSIVVVFSGLVVLAVAGFSKTLRAQIRDVLVRNFFRSKYDYRAQWLHITNTFRNASSRESIMDCLLDLLIKTFPTTVLSIWAYREADRRFWQMRSMTGEGESARLELSHPVVKSLQEKEEPIFLEDVRAAAIRDGLSSDDALVGSRADLCFPIHAQGRLVAIIVLGTPLGGGTYGTDDLDLLRGLAHHVGALLSQARMAEERRASAELDALHRFSLFCFHDIKNLAARLSLVAQNAEIHGKDQSFQASAMRTVTDTAKKMTALMSKLSMNSSRPLPVAAFERVDLSPVIEEVLAPIRNDGRTNVYMTGNPLPPVEVVKDQIHQVLLNMILNAKQALKSDNGVIRIAFEQQGDMAIVTVEDTGGGIPESKFDSLFQPAQSSRPGGLGIGLFQCKQIVEAHHGSIEVQSELGQGTKVRIQLPLVQPSATMDNSTDASVH